jgi:Reverse transcriptase (RNA-dependent DNA polymerase)
MSSQAIGVYLRNVILMEVFANTSPDGASAVTLKDKKPVNNRYIPVVSWSTARMMLLLGLICGLETTQIDYTNAFVQADLSERAYMELPYKLESELGKGIDDPIIQLNKSLYGGALAAKHWFDKLSNFHSLLFHLSAMADLLPALLPSWSC